MRFYDRESELASLRDTATISRKTSQFTVVLGRRRIGKTTLMLKGSEGTKTVYLFISRLREPLLCARLKETALAAGVDLPGRFDAFDDLLRALMVHSRTDPITVIIDEFQNLEYVDKSVFGRIQEVWDTEKDASKINLIVGGSVHSLMVGIFEDEREPLFGRPTRKLEVRPFRTSVLKQILSDHNPSCTNRDLLTLYMLTGGVPSYVSILMDAGAVTSDAMLDFALSPGSVFLCEGNDLMTEEFGKDNRTYLSILQLIASGKASRSEIEDSIGMGVGEYLKRLEEEYGFVSRRLPMITEDARLGRWRISDMYLTFYFRYIQPNASFVESGRTDLLGRVVMDDMDSYEGRVLEEYLRTKVSEEWEYTEVGSYWNRNGSVEVDIVVLDSIKKEATLVEVKRNPAKLDMRSLERKAEAMSGLLKGYDVKLMGMSMDDM